MRKTHKRRLYIGAAFVVTTASLPITMSLGPDGLSAWQIFRIWLGCAWTAVCYHYAVRVAELTWPPRKRRDY